MTDYLEKYFPVDNVSKTIQSPIIVTSKDDAFKLWENLVTAIRLNVSSFLVIGKILASFKRDRTYEILDYETFAEFLASEELGFSQESAYMYIRTYEFYIEELGLDPQKVSQMNLGRLSLLLPKLKKMDISSQREEIIEQIEEAHSVRHNDFIRQLKAETNKDGKPDVYWSKEKELWVVVFYENKTHFQSLGLFEEKE